MDIPVGTVSRDRTERGDSTRGAARDRPRASASVAGRDGRTDPERVAALERRVEFLETELERKDRRLQSVIDRYEHLLAEARRNGNAGDTGSTADGSVLTAVRDALGR